MTTKEKRKRHTFVSPRGTYVFPKLNEPDHGTKEYPKPDGEYSVKLRMQAEAPETKAFIAKLEPLHKAAVEKAEGEFQKLKVDQRKKLKAVTVNDFFVTVYDKETEEPTGEIEFKFACKAGGEYKTGPKAGKKWSRTVTLFDAKGTPMKNAPSIWGGTIGKVSFMVEEGGYFIPGTGAAGIKLSLEAVQIITLQSGSAKDAKGYGFGEEEGFTASSSDEFPADDSTAESGDAKDDNDDF